MSVLHQSDLSGKPIEGEVDKIQVAYYRSDEEVENLVNELAVGGKLAQGLTKPQAFAAVKENSKVFRELEVSKEELEKFKQEYFKLN